MKFIHLDRILFWTVFGLLCFSAKLALIIFAGGLLYNLAVSIHNRFARKDPA